MSDNNYELEYKTPMNDLPEHGEVITKKPYYDNGSTLTPLPQEKNETKQPEKINGYHRYYCEQQSVEKKCILAKNEIIALISYILLILMCIGDIIIQVCCKIFTPWFLPDNIAGLGMAIVLLIFFIIKRTVDNCTLITLNTLALFGGLVVKFVGLYIIDHSEKNTIKDKGGFIGVSILSCFKVIASCISIGFYVNDCKSQSNNY